LQSCSGIKNLQFVTAKNICRSYITVNLGFSYLHLKFKH